MSSPAYQRLRFELQENPNLKFGFIVYRCTYESDEEWHRFMAYLDTTVRASMKRRQLDDICDRIDWAVQEGKDLDGASVEVVRQRFQAWVADNSAGGQRYGGSRHHACIMVKQAHVDEALEFVTKTADEQMTLSDPSVYLVSARDGNDDDEYGPYTEMQVSSLMPWAYALLQGPGWPSIHE